MSSGTTPPDSANSVSIDSSIALAVLHFHPSDHHSNIRCCVDQGEH